MRFFGAACLIAFATTAAVAQEQRSATREMLDRGRAALNDLQYLRADSIARDVLELALLARPARIEALELIAAANFPASQADQRTAQARSAISELVRLDMSLTIPRDLTWAGLDSLYSDVLRTVYATSVLVRRENPVAGINGGSILRVRANRPSAFSVRARTRDGIESILLDSVSTATDTTLTLRVARAGKLILQGGEYDFVVTATERATKETFVRSFEGIAIVPPFELAPIPAVDSTALRPERAAPERVTGIVAGLLVGAGTIVIGKSLRAGDPIRSAGETDTRYTIAGVLMAVGSAAAAWFDRGRVLDKNHAANRQSVGAAEARRQAAVEENARRAADYRASISLNPEWR